MKVKIRDKIYDSHDEPIMLILEETDKKNVCNMGDQGMYCVFPNGMKPNDARVFMELRPLSKKCSGCRYDGENCMCPVVCVRDRAGNYTGYDRYTKDVK